MADRRLKMGMIGGGPGAFIGPIHAMAARLDGRIDLVAGAFSRDPGKNRAAADGYHIAADRVYDDWREMLSREAARADGIDMVTIVTPNDTHFAISKAALNAGFDVLCDKPATLTVDEALALQDVVLKSRGRYGLTYTYSGYALVREARVRLAAGAIGRVRKVIVEYPQGWLSRPGATPQAIWRADPRRAGPGGCVADIGVHAFHLVEFVTGDRVVAVQADLGHVVPGRPVDDDCDVMMRFESGARGIMLASQIAAGDLNGLRLRVYGEAGGLDWRQEAPNTLTLHYLDAPSCVLHAGADYLSPQVRALSRAPAGHPEGYLDAFANLYRDFAACRPVPGIVEGVRGVAFVAASLRSHRERRAVALKDMIHEDA